MEVFKDIIGNEGLYQISVLGNVKSIKSNKILTGINNGLGYLRVSLPKNDKKSLIYIHRLVAQAFIPNPKNKPFVNHINGIKNDNRIENLEWCTHKENSHHALINKLYTGARPVECSQFSFNGNLINKYKSQQEAMRITGIFQSNIWKCMNGQRKSAGGYIWK